MACSSDSDSSISIDSSTESSTMCRVLSSESLLESSICIIRLSRMLRLCDELIDMPRIIEDDIVQLLLFHLQFFFFVITFNVEAGNSVNYISVSCCQSINTEFSYQFEIIFTDANCFACIRSVLTAEGKLYSKQLFLSNKKKLFFYCPSTLVLSKLTVESIYSATRTVKIVGRLVGCIA